MKAIKLAVVLALVAGGIVLAAESTRGMHVRETLYKNRICCDMSALAALNATIHEEVFGDHYPSQLGQDKWVLFRMFPRVKDGFFLDVGSGEGTNLSNTKALEERGWKGICIDPFPSHMEGRTCQVFKEVVWSKPGVVVEFHPSGDFGGVKDTLGRWKDEGLAAPGVKLSTVTLAHILERAQAPSFINFMSLDIEGAELEALRGLPFDKYKFGAMAIEHNFEEPKRSDIQNFLSERGYERVHTRRHDDFYAPKAR
jgi:FkbM family methyltransferase